MSAVLADYVWSDKFLILWIFAVSQNKIKSLDSPAESVILIWWLAIGYHPLATEFLALFLLYSNRKSISVVHTKESISACIKTIHPGCLR